MTVQDIINAIVRVDQAIHRSRLMGEIRMNSNHDPKNGRFTSGNSSKSIDKSAESGIMKSSDDDYISAKGPNTFDKGFSKINLVNHWYGNDDPLIHSHKDDYEKRGYDMKGYGELALDLIQKPVGNGIEGHKTKDGFVVRYDTKTGDFVKGHPKKGIATMFEASHTYYIGQKDTDEEDVI